MLDAACIHALDACSDARLQGDVGSGVWMQSRRSNLRALPLCPPPSGKRPAGRAGAPPPRGPSGTSRRGTAPPLLRADCCSPSLCIRRHIPVWPASVSGPSLSPSASLHPSPSPCLHLAADRAAARPRRSGGSTQRADETERPRGPPLRQRHRGWPIEQAIDPAAGAPPPPGIPARPGEAAGAGAAPQRGKRARSPRRLNPDRSPRRLASGFRRRDRSPRRLTSGFGFRGAQWRQRGAGAVPQPSTYPRRGTPCLFTIWYES